MGAGRSAADLPDLAAPPPGASRGLLTSVGAVAAMSHLPRVEAGKRVGSPPPPTARALGHHPSQGVHPAPRSHQLLPPAEAGGSRKGKKLRL